MALNTYFLPGIIRVAVQTVILGANLRNRQLTSRSAHALSILYDSAIPAAYSIDRLGFRLAPKALPRIFIGRGTILIDLFLFDARHSPHVVAFAARSAHICLVETSGALVRTLYYFSCRPLPCIFWNEVA